MSSRHSKKFTTVRDSIASLFKRRKSADRVDSGGAGDGNGNGNGNGAGAGAGRISTPQNVKRVMHITFDSGSQSFDGIPAHWRQYFEAAPAEAAVSHPEIAASHPKMAASHPEIAASHPEIAASHPEIAASHPKMAVSHPKMAASHPEIAASHPEEAAAATAEAPLTRPPAAPREVLSLVYDRDMGQFVNLPPHWEERMKRNNLLEPEFQSNPHLLPLVFSLMDQELRSMKAEGARVESCLYSSLGPQCRSKAPPPLPLPPPTPSPPQSPSYLFQIEADKSNSSSELDLATDPTPVLSPRLAPSRQRGSFVTISAVEMPRALDTQL